MKKNLKRLKDFRCPAPFRELQIFNSSTSPCCPEWFDQDVLKKEFQDELLEKYEDKEHFPRQISTHDVSTITDINDLSKNWNNKFHTKLREAISEGDYKYCSMMCPWVNEHSSLPEKEFKTKFINPHTGKNTSLQPFEEKYKNQKLPDTVYLNFDASCNLKCPSCRLNLNTNWDNPDAANIMKSFDNQFSEGVEKVVCTGSGDPFYSNVFRNWLQTFDSKKYPKLKKLFIVTNGNMLTEKMWNSISNVHPFIEGIEISIDAAEKETYENKVRLNGRWDVLMDNLKFLSTLTFKETIDDPILRCTFSFVVQDHNVHQMVDFVDMIENIFKNSFIDFNIMFRAIQDWRMQTEEWYRDRNVCVSTHPKYPILIQQLKKLVRRTNEAGYNFVHSNLYHLLEIPISSYEEDIKQEINLNTFEDRLKDLEKKLDSNNRLI